MGEEFQSTLCTQQVLLDAVARGIILRYAIGMDFQIRSNKSETEAWQKE